MLLGARTAAWGGGGRASWRDYYDGGHLIGLWTPKGGRNGDVLSDLSGNGHDMTFVGDCSITDDYVAINGRSGAYASVSGFSYGPNVTAEIVMSVSAFDNVGRVMAENRGLAVVSWQSSFTISYLYGFGQDTFIYSGNPIRMTADEVFSQGFAVTGTLFNHLVNGSYVFSRSVNRTSYAGQTTFFNRATGARGIDGKLFCVRYYDIDIGVENVLHNNEVDYELFGVSLAS